MNVAGYVRVSTDKQADKGYSIGEQSERLAAYCRAKEWNLVKIYTDPGFTGANIERPALQQLMSDCSSYDIVLVNKLDRLSRSQKDTLYLIQDVFAPAGCSFVSMQESFDTTTPLGIAMVGILSAFAQLERSQIKERMRMGKEGRKKKGLWHGGVNAPTGYDYTDGQLVPNEEADQVRLVFQKYISGESIRDITRYMGAHFSTRYTSWGYAGTVRRILSNPIYVGMIGECEGQHPAIIDRAVFDRAQILLLDHQRGKKAPTGRHLLTGMIWCGNCGERVRCVSTSLTVAGERKKYSYYRCGRADTSAMNKLSHPCGLKPHRENEVDEAVISELKKLRFENIVIEPMSSVDNSAEIEKIGHQLSRLIDLYSICDGDVAELAAKIKKLKQKRDDLIAEQQTSAGVPSELLIDSLALVREVFDTGTVEQRRAILDSLIDRVILFNDRIEIEWKFSQSLD